MPTPATSKEVLLKSRDAIHEALRNGHAPMGVVPPAGTFGAVRQAALAMGISAAGMQSRVGQMARAGIQIDWSLYSAPQPYVPNPEHETPPDAAGRVHSLLKAGRRSLIELQTMTGLSAGSILDAIDMLRHREVRVERMGDAFQIPRDAQPAFLRGATITMVSNDDNTYTFGACGDLHAGSKYCRWDVRDDLFRRYADAGVQAVFDTGNWIEGEARFNRYDIEAHGLDAQVRLLAKRHPKTNIPVYAVTGDDHEGWYSQSMGVDVGSYCERVMREEGHNWTDLGYMESHIILRNANTGAEAVMAVVHPGGGSAYALSYSIQKIVESYEGGEKPHVALYGHYHKLWSGIIRNVWVVQTGCAQDQTPFMRKKRLEAHVGGTLIKLEQDPTTGAILGMNVQMLRYFNRTWYDNRWSKAGDVTLPERGAEFIR